MAPTLIRDKEPKTLIAKRLQEVLGKENSNSLCGKIDLTRQQIGRILRGDSLPTYKLLEFIALNGGDLAYIFTGKKTSRQTEASSDDDFLRIVLERWELLSTKQKAMFAAEITETTEEKNPENGAEIG